MSKHELAKQEYLKRFSDPEISIKPGENGIKVHRIGTENYEIKPLIAKSKQFEKFSTDIKELYWGVFNNPIVMATYTDGNIWSKEKFTEIVNAQSSRWKKNYPFAGFIIKTKGNKSKDQKNNLTQDRDNQNVVGYIIIGNAENDSGYVPNTARISYLISTDYQGKGVGYECVGAVVLFYAEELFKKKILVNRLDGMVVGLENKFNNIGNKANKSGTETGGTIFEKIEAKIHYNNPASKRILEKIGFSNIDKENINPQDREGNLPYYYVKNFGEEATTDLAGVSY